MWQAMSFDVIQEKRRVRRAGAAEIAAPPAGAAENAAFLAAIDAAIDAAEISEDDSDEDTQQDATDNAGSQDPALAAAAPTGAAQGAAGPTGATQHATESDEETQCEWCGSVEEIFRVASGLVLCQECDDDSWGWQKHDFIEQAAAMNAAAMNPSDSIEAECNWWGSIEETFRDWDSADVERLIRFFGRDKAGAHQFWHRYERQIRRMLQYGFQIRSEDTESDEDTETDEETLDDAESEMLAGGAEVHQVERKGTTVRVSGLVTDTEVNGKLGVILSLDDEPGEELYYVVRLFPGTVSGTVSLRQCNITAAPAHMDQSE